MNNTTTATPVPGAVAVLSLETLPDGVQVVTVPCDDYAAVKALPVAIELGGVRYGRTGWNSDTHVAYYRNDATFAIAS